MRYNCIVSSNINTIYSRYKRLIDVSDFLFLYRISIILKIIYFFNEIQNNVLIGMIQLSCTIVVSQTIRTIFVGLISSKFEIKSNQNNSSEQSIWRTHLLRDDAYVNDTDMDGIRPFHRIAFHRIIHIFNELFKIEFNIGNLQKFCRNQWWAREGVEPETPPGKNFGAIPPLGLWRKNFF